MNLFNVPLIILLIALSTGEAISGSILFTGILPGGVGFKKQVTSMKEQRFLNVEKQNTDFSCGAAALATILKYGYGINTNEDQVLRGLMKISDQDQARKYGFSMLDMKRYVGLLELRGRGYRLPEERLDRIRIPVIVLLDIEGYKHFVVFKKSRGEKVYIADPALGNKILKKDEFVEGWNGVVFAIIHKNFDTNSILLDPSEPISVDKKNIIKEVTRRVSVETGRAQIIRHFDCVFCF